MAKLEILHYPDPRLRNVARAVDTVDERVRKLIDDMFETMYEAPGIGLAAIQVNVPLRVITIDVSDERDSPLALVNPEITALDGSIAVEEGCLSVPEAFEKVTRAEHIEFQALGRDGERFEMQASGLLAVCVQHEVDHLNGRLFVDHLSTLKRERIRKRLEKASRGRAVA